MYLSLNSADVHYLMSWPRVPAKRYKLPLVNSRKRHWPTIDICMFEELNVTLRKGQRRVNGQGQRWRETESFFPSCMVEIERWEKWEDALFSLSVMKSRAEGIFAGNPARHAVGLLWRCLHGCVWERGTSSSNEQNKLCEYEKMWSLFNVSTHISNIHIYIFCTMNIPLVCNLSGLIIASRLCHKYIIHSAIWSLCTRVSLLYMSHECVTHSTCMNQKQNHKALKLFFCETQFRLSQVCSHLVSQADEKK